MLRIRVYENGSPARSVDLTGAFLVGNDRVPIRGELSFSDGEISCESRARGAAALSVLWPVNGMGRLMLETPRLQERKEPYNLNVELARGQLMRIAQKREDWGLYDLAEGEKVYAEVDQARDLLIQAVTAPDEGTAARLGDAALSAALKAGEQLCMLHSDLFLERRQAANQFARRPMGARVDPNQTSDAHLKCLMQAFDFGVLPFSWSAMEPREGTHKPTSVDLWLKACRQHKFPLWGASLVSFEADHLPEWLTKGPRDYEQVRDAVTRHIRHVVKTYGAFVQAWEVINGAHAQSAFRFTFEQIMELTRLSSLLVKQMAPKSLTIVGITMPWGEYYASDPRSIPPAMYAEMAVQSGVNFDAFGLDLRLGTGTPPHYVRDMMQISSLLDRFGNFGKPIHITTAGVPSGGGEPRYGHWHETWSDDVQASWFRQFYRVAMSKPFVESVTCMRLADNTALDGVLNLDCSPKPAFRELLDFRRNVLGA